MSFCCSSGRFPIYLGHHPFNDLFSVAKVFCVMDHKLAHVMLLIAFVQGCQGVYPLVSMIKGNLFPCNYSLPELMDFSHSLGLDQERLVTLFGPSTRSEVSIRGLVFRKTWYCLPHLSQPQFINRGGGSLQKWSDSPHFTQGHPPYE